MLKKSILVLLVFYLIFCFSACGTIETRKNPTVNAEAQPGVSQSTAENAQTSSNQSRVNTAENSQTSSDRSKTSIAENAQTSSNQSKATATHTHYYSSSVTVEATCGKEGVRTYRCSCGNSYTESIGKKNSHNWASATCTSPKKCKDCGATEGTAKEHDYRSYDGYKCSMCGQIDPEVQRTLEQCSLQLPTLPKTLTYYGYSNKIYSKVEVTNITYQFEYYGNGNVTLTAKFSGTKTYDYKGTGQSSSCKIGWKLYDPDGNVFRTGTFTSPNIAVNESFANQEDDLIYNFEATKPGKYRLEILNVN